MQLFYGPTGHGASARKDDKVWDYLYDEQGERIDDVTNAIRGLHSRSPPFRPLWRQQLIAFADNS